MVTRGRYAEGTTVTPEQSRAELDRILQRHGADAVFAGYDSTRIFIRWILHGRHFERVLGIPAADDPSFAPPNRQYDAAYCTAYRKRKREEERRRLWRVLVLWLKTSLELVESGAASLEEALLPFVVLPDGRTVGDLLAPQIADAYATGKMPALLPSGRE